MKFLLIFFSACTLLLACQRKIYPNPDQYHFRSADGKPDYSKTEYWAAHPGKWDPSDSIPKDLRDTYQKEELADVFLVLV